MALINLATETVGVLPIGKGGTGNMHGDARSLGGFSAPLWAKHTQVAAVMQIIAGASITTSVVVTLPDPSLEQRFRLLLRAYVLLGLPIPPGLEDEAAIAMTIL